MSVVGSNAALFLASVFLLEGTREFGGLPPQYSPAYVLAGCGMLAQVYFLVGRNDLTTQRPDDKDRRYSLFALDSWI